MLLRFPDSRDLNDLFSCSSCGTSEVRGVQCMKALMLDGAALGVLGKLPVFDRVSTVRPAVNRIPKQQYIMKNPTYMAFVDGILISARRNIEDGEFTPETAEKLKSIREGLFEKFFHTDLADSDEAHVVNRLLKQRFSVSSRNRTVIERTEHEDVFLGRQDNYTVTFVLRYKFDDIELRQSIVNFGRCFLSGSNAYVFRF